MVIMGSGIPRGRVRTTTTVESHNMAASIEAFCLRMLHKKNFNVSNRWYAPALHVSKMAIVATNVSVMEVVFFFFPFVT